MKKSKKIFLLFGALMALFAIMFAPIVSVYAADGDPEDNTEDVGGGTAVVMMDATVVEEIGEGGNVLFDITEGHAGQVVTALVTTDFLYVVTSVKINGSSIEVEPDNKYEFVLLPGENKFSVTFAISNEKVAEIVDLIETVRDNGISSLFTMKNLITLIAWAILFVLSSGFLVTLIKTKKLKSKTTDEIVGIVTTTLESEQAKILKKFLEAALGETLDKITSKMDNVDECIKALCRTFVLAQEETPEARLAIIEELTKLNNTDEALSAQIRAIIKEEQVAQQQAIEKRDKSIQELKENNESLVPKTENEDNYGQI